MHINTIITASVGADLSRTPPIDRPSVHVLISRLMSFCALYKWVLQVMQLMQMLQLLLANLIFLSGIMQIHAQTQAQNVTTFGIRQQYLIQVL
jgi:hypothetical protein